MKSFILTIITFSISALSASAETERVKVGVVLPLTGAFTRYGQKIQTAISAFSNPTIEFVYEDEGCDPKLAITSYKKLTDINGVRYFLGPWCGSPQMAMAPQLKIGKQLAVLGSSAPVAVFPASDQRMFSTQHSIEDESEFLAKKIAVFGAKSVAIVFKENSFSRAHEASFRSHYHGKIFDTFAYTSSDISELKSVALQIKKLKPDALYVPDAFPLMAGFVKELHTIGAGNIPIYSVYSAQSDDVLNVLGKDGEGLIYSYPDIGEKEATEYFPSLAAETLVGVITKCGNDVECSKNKLLSDKQFDANGVLTGKLILKTIRDGKFVKYEG